MSRITFNREYNFWDILVAVGIQPYEHYKYKYNVDGDVATLIIDSVSQSDLERALSKYDHQKYLDGLPKSTASEIEVLKQKVETQQAIIEELLFEVIPTLLTQTEEEMI